MVMNIERINATLNRAILGLQGDEIEGMLEAMAQGVTSYNVPMPGEVRGREKQRGYKQLVVHYLKRNRLKVNKTQLRKLLKRYTDRSFWRELGSDDIHSGFLYSAIEELIDELKSVKDYKRELAKLEREQGAAHTAAGADAFRAPGRAMGRKSSRDRGMAWRANKMRSIERTIAELGG